MSTILTSSDHSNIVDAVRHSAREAPSDKAVGLVSDPSSDGEEVLKSYARLDEEARRVAVVLHRSGLSAGSRVLLLFPPSASFAVAFLGCLYAGMVAVPSPLPSGTLRDQRRVRGIAADCAAAAVLTAGSTHDDVASWAQAYGLTGTPVLNVEALPGDPHAEEWQEVSVTPDTVALLQYTSGSTGDPKGVVVTHRHIAVNAAALRRGFELPEGTRFGGWLPLYHDMGLLALLTPALLSGSCCVLMDAASFLRRPRRWLEMIDRFGIGFSAAPNFAYDYCVQRVPKEQLEGLDLSGWLRAANGSEPVHADTLTGFTRHFADAGFRPEAMTACYGLAESTVFVGARPGGIRTRSVDAELLASHFFQEASPGDPAREVVSCGTVRDAEVEIVDPESGLALPSGHIGEIRLRGESVAHGYWQNAEATGATFLPDAAGEKGMLLCTGDLGVVHDGELYVTGRIKDMLIVHGRNLYPHDIEQELRSRHPELGPAGAVFTCPDSSGHEAVVVSHEVTGRPSGQPAEDLARALRSTLAREFGIRAAGVVLVRRGGTPRTTSGKIQRTLMRELFREGAVQSVWEDEGARRLAGTRPPAAGPLTVAR